MQIQVNRQAEPIEVTDSDGKVVLRWEVPTDDASLRLTVVRAANAVNRAAELNEAIESAETPEASAKSKADMVALHKQVITAVLGDGAYDDILAYMGDGEPVDPMENICNIGEIFAALCVWLYDHATSKGLREAAKQLAPESAESKRPRKGRKGK